MRTFSQRCVRITKDCNACVIACILRVAWLKVWELKPKLNMNPRTYRKMSCTTHVTRQARMSLDMYRPMNPTVSSVIITVTSDIVSYLCYYNSYLCYYNSYLCYNSI
uniref:Uncharacterized protein n=1 Tax=Cacopsylla melanoneura TaxID=428564 RepID=A0A8D8W336_9HEMI